MSARQSPDRALSKNCSLLCQNGVSELGTSSSDRAFMCSNRAASTSSSVGGSTPSASASRAISAGEVGPLVGVVEEVDVRPVPGVPERAAVVDERREPDDLGRRPVALDPPPEPLDRVVGGGCGSCVHPELGEVVEADGRGAELEEAVEVDVGEVVVPRHGGVARIAADVEVGDALVLRQAAEGRVRLDEAAVRLRLEGCPHLVERAGVHVEPRRECGQRRREVGRSEQEQRTASASRSCRTSAGC